MRKKVIAWSLFLACVLFLSLAATPYSRTADELLITVRLTLLIVISILVVRERWRHPHESQHSTTSGSSDVGSTFLNRFRHWYHGDE
ncbi:MAG TPA: hypothetical protein VN025_18510 [Candidatus Dormibacteraeota bacterium]|jgi:hypothetical protein|nr:hypothetical protein [Candidatus Dormibacteraeota bacterium]